MNTRINTKENPQGWKFLILFCIKNIFGLRINNLLHLVAYIPMKDKNKKKTVTVTSAIYLFVCIQ
jgi:hypothetical protein